MARLTWLDGSWVVRETLPDGDTLHFLPDQPALVGAFLPRLRQHPEGTLAVRLYGIDTAELHYRRRSQATVRQPYPWVELATQGLLTFLGFAPQLPRSRHGRIIEGQPCRGAVAVLGSDRHGRAIGLVQRGEHTPRLDRFQSASAAEWLTSANLALIQAGLAWPLLALDFPDVWLPSLLQALDAARLARRGIWRCDCSHSGFSCHAETWQALQTSQLIWPFLFRRMADLHARQRPTPEPDPIAALDRRVGHVRLRSAGCHVRFGDLLQYEQQALQLLVAPEDILFPGYRRLL